MKNEQQTIKTKLKFEKSRKKPSQWIGFVFVNSENGYIRGVREDAPEYKKICIVKDPKLAEKIEAEVLYDVEMVHLPNSIGYEVISAEQHMFTAHIDSCIIHNAIYRVQVKFGGKTITYNPLDGKYQSMRSIPQCISVLESKKDIRNLAEVVDEFTKAANIVLTTFQNDGYYVPKTTKYKTKTSKKA